MLPYLRHIYIKSAIDLSGFLYCHIRNIWSWIPRQIHQYSERRHLEIGLFLTYIPFTIDPSPSNTAHCYVT